MTTPIANSSYLDYTAYNLTTATTVAEAYGLSPSDIAPATDGINVAFMLPRVSDPTALLSGNWAERQQTIENLGTGIWDVYGADATTFNNMVTYMQGQGEVLGLTADQSEGAYVSSAASRTIWVNFTPQQFEDFFGQQLFGAASETYDTNQMFWNGELSLPDSWNPAWTLAGLWMDGSQAPDASNMAGNVSVPLLPGAQSPGNTLGSLGTSPNIDPQKIAADYYNFPLDGKTVTTTGSVAFVEQGIGTALDNPPHSFQYYLEQYRDRIGAHGTGQAYTQGRSGQSWDDSLGDGGERSLDIGIFTAINPNSDIGVYAGSGYNGEAWADVFTAYQAAIWLQPDNPGAGWTAPAVISSSWRDLANPNPNSLFYQAWSELLIDAALQNQTVLTAIGDGGSAAEQANGLTNVTYNFSSPYSLLVGGTAISTTESVAHDPTLTSLYQSAAAWDRATLWQLVAGGLMTMPQGSNRTSTFVETVWNEYYVNGHTFGTDDSFSTNNTGSGGVDTTQPIPSYQLDFGLSPTTTTSPVNGVGRGLPDVSGNAGGNTYYLTPDQYMTGTTGNGGTSAATPMWAALVVQFNTIFADQDLPQLGYMNDLLYQAAAIAPGAFNDITIGSNTSSYYVSSTPTSNSYWDGSNWLTPTGYGYEAAPGYDLVSGLGSPNGTLLARALTAIAHQQKSYAGSLGVLVDDPFSGWTSGADQTLLFQTDFAAATNWAISVDGSAVSFNGMGSTAYAWNSLFAQKVLQADFSSSLVTLFDGFAQGSLQQAQLAGGNSLAIAIGGTLAGQPQINLTSQFGFVDFVSGNGTSAVTVARPVALAETVGDADDQNVVVRMRQGGVNESAITFYKVDDFNGTIGGLAPGDAGYAQAVAARAYHTNTGATAVTGAGYGQYSQAQLVGVDGGDHIAMVLTSAGHTFYAFAQANEVVNGQAVGHIWSYGLNTWGWEDLYGGGDRDYNDLVVQLDFTSAYGSQWLV